MASSDSQRGGARDKLKTLWRECGKVYIDRAVFNACIVTIEDWINIKGMVPHFMTYGLASRARQIDNITDITELMKHVDMCGGRHGYFLLYVCLYKSQESNLGHQDACRELQEKAREMGVRAPWDDGAANVEPVGQRHYSNQGEDVERDYTPSSSGAPRPTQSQDEGGPSSAVYSQAIGACISQQNRPVVTDDGWKKKPLHDLTPLMPYDTSSSKSRGLALIINNSDFSKSNRHLSKRHCGPQDGDRLVKTFRDSGYRVRLETNKTAEEIRHIFSRLLPEGDHDAVNAGGASSSNDDGVVHEGDDSFVCCVVSHGDWDESKQQDVVYGSDGEHVSVQELALEYLTVPLESDSQRKNYLKQKPKLFFVHACRGPEITPVSADDGKSGAKRLPRLPQVKLLPLSADFLFSYPVVPGTKAFRDDQSGTFYIESLCQMIEKFREKLDVESIVKRVHYELTSAESAAYNYEHEDGKTIMVRHCPQTISSLRGPFFLTKKAEDKYRKYIK